MGEVCDICGDVGLKDVLYTCSKCHIACEHSYCRKLGSGFSKHWVCEICSVEPAENKATNPAEEKVFKQPATYKSSDRPVKLVPRWERDPDRGKVKLLSAEEAIRLSSGSPRKTCPSSNVCRRLISSGPPPGFAPRIIHGLGAENPKSNFVNLNPNLSRQSKAVEAEHGAQQISSKDFLHANKTREAAEGKRDPIAVARKSSCRKGVERKVRFKELATCYANSENTNDNPDRNTDATTGAGALPVHLFIQCCPFLPAKYHTWMVSFLVSPSATSQELYEGFLAQSTCRVHRKVFEFSKKMPSVHQVELLPKDSVLMDLFENEMPDLSDVAFYFFPDESIERSKENHACLFEIMEVQKSVIRSSMNGVELFVFTSKQLNEVSQSIISVQRHTRDFLWGVLRQIKNFSTQHLFSESVCCDTNGVEIQEAIDMDIDMEGDQILGNDDAKLPQDTSGIACERSDEEMGESNKSRRQSASDFPPGFEAMPYFKSRNSPRNDAVVETDFKECGQPSEKQEIRFSPQTNYVKLNVAASAAGSSSYYGAAGIVRGESGEWILGYILNLNHTTSLSAEFWAIFQGLKLVWEKGYRRILVEFADSEGLEALEKDSSMITANKCIIKCCKEIISRSWDCKLYCISTLQNASTSWLANQFEKHDIGFFLLDEPPGSLIPLLENDRLTLTSQVQQR